MIGKENGLNLRKTGLCQMNYEHILNKTQVRILAELRNNPNITKVLLMKRLNLGKTSIDNGLSTLKKYGYVERVGSRKSGYWKVLI